MGVVRTKWWGYTPVCNDCGVHLCWDISEEEYEAKPNFWDNWKCEVCNGSRMHPTRS